MTQQLSQRLLAIDALRGFVILIMLLDHVRETIYLHHQVPDPMNISETEPALFFSRMASHLCAPVFVFLTGLSAYLFQQKSQSIRETRLFLLKRGLFLIFLELTLVNFAWTAQFPPEKVYLQVIWAIGLSMIALSVLIGLPRILQITLAGVIIVGHNLLDFIDVSQSESAWKYLWYILHDRGWIEISEQFKMRTSYPLLPWIGVILAGYAMGTLFTSQVSFAQRKARLLKYAMIGLGSFFVLRFINIYGDKAWQNMPTTLETVMSFFNLTKYPPSLFFILFNVSIGLLLLVLFERYQQKKWIYYLTVYGSVPMFFYLLHLYVLKLIYVICVALFGLTHGKYFGVDDVSTLWIVSIILSVALYPIVLAFAKFKHSHKHISILKYF